MRITHRQLVNASKEYLIEHGFKLKENKKNKFIKASISFVAPENKLAFVCIIPPKVLNKDRAIRKAGYKMILIMPEFSTLNQIIKIKTEDMAKYSSYQKKQKKKKIGGRKLWKKK